MIQVISTEKVPIKAWLDNIEEGALEQAKNLANLPFIFKHVALMPDCHQGYGMPIGGVIATKGNVIIPNAVGKDIGCGVCAIKTNLTGIEVPALEKIINKIKEIIPLGFKHHQLLQQQNLMPGFDISNKNFSNSDTRSVLSEYVIVKEEFQSALRQLGTLGGGNHFIEIQKNTKDDCIWVMIHSGSRNLGARVAAYYNKIAIELNEKWYSSVPVNHQLAFLPMDTEEGKNYYKEMEYCVKFAFANRRLMMERVIDVLEQVLETTCCPDRSSILDVAHNYATIEDHFGKNVIVHRKGATKAREGKPGIIPGSQGSKSYIVVGKGCRDSFKSCSHGAGRSMSVTKAINTLLFEDEISKLNSLGTIHTVQSKEDLGESLGAYKDIAVVMENQKDLVDIAVELTPVATIKGKK